MAPITYRTDIVQTTAERLKKAYATIRSEVDETPVLTSPTLSGLVTAQLNVEHDKPERSKGIELFFKCENMQKSGSFKYRGAMYSVACLSDEDLQRGLLTTSSGMRAAIEFHLRHHPLIPPGNLAKALADVAHKAAEDRGYPIPVTAVMPRAAMQSKIVGARKNGADVFCSGNSWAERDAALRKLHNDTGATVISTSNNPDIVIGQGTLGIEFIDQIRRWHNIDLDGIIAPCGSGGLLSGLAIALQGTKIKVFGAEPEEGGADDAARGLDSGCRVEVVNSSSMADGLRCPLGKLPWEIIRQSERIAGIYSATEAQIKLATRIVVEEMKTVIEPSAAVPLAVILFNQEFRAYMASQGQPWRLGIVLSGGNVELDHLKGLLC